jgi:hypothetical protein
MAEHINIATQESSGADDVIIARIGQSNLASFIKGQGLEKTAVILTQSRIYGRSQSYGFRGSRRIRFVGDVAHMNSIELNYESNPWWLVLGAIFLISGINTMLNGPFSALFFAISSILLSFIFFIAYPWSRRKILVINLGGYPHSVSLAGVREQEITAFMSATMLWLTQRARFLAGAESV